MKGTVLELLSILEVEEWVGQLETRCEVIFPKMPFKAERQKDKDK